jgi:hypothetical protein
VAAHESARAAPDIEAAAVYAGIGVKLQVAGKNAVEAVWRPVQNPHRNPAVDELWAGPAGREQLVLHAMHSWRRLLRLHRRIWTTKLKWIQRPENQLWLTATIGGNQRKLKVRKQRRRLRITIDGGGNAAVLPRWRFEIKKEQKIGSELLVTCCRQVERRR